METQRTKLQISPHNNPVPLIEEVSGFGWGNLPKGTLRDEGDHLRGFYKVCGGVCTATLKILKDFSLSVSPGLESVNRSVIWAPSGWSSSWSHPLSLVWDSQKTPWAQPLLRTLQSCVSMLDEDNFLSKLWKTESDRFMKIINLFIQPIGMKSSLFWALSLQWWTDQTWHWPCGPWNSVNQGHN